MLIYLMKCFSWWSCPSEIFMEMQIPGLMATDINKCAEVQRYIYLNIELPIDAEIFFKL